MKQKGSKARRRTPWRGLLGRHGPTSHRPTEKKTSEKRKIQKNTKERLINATAALLAFQVQGKQGFRQTEPVQGE